MYSLLEAITKKEITTTKKKKKKWQSHRFVVDDAKLYCTLWWIFTKLILNHENDKPEHINFVVKLENVPSN